MRWLTVRPPAAENQELLLLDPLHSMLDEESARQVRALIAKGALSPGRDGDIRTARVTTRRWPIEVSIHPGTGRAPLRH